MNWKEQYVQLREALTAVYEQSEAEAIASLVVEHAGIGKMNQLKQLEVSNENKEQINHILKQLLTHRPVQYVLNEAWFYGLKFEVNESVLIPRPETEELVDWIVKDVRSMKYEVRRMPRRTPSSYGLKGLSILDIGTGSGCIPITLKKNLPQTEVSAIDVCSEALHTAMNNAVNHETEINFQLLDCIFSFFHIIERTGDYLVAIVFRYNPCRDVWTLVVDNGRKPHRINLFTQFRY